MFSVDMTGSTFSPDGWIAAALRGELPNSGSLSQSEMEHIGKAAIRHGVETLLYSTLWPDDESMSRAPRTIPEPLHAQLKQITRQQIAWDMLRQRDLSQILDQLSEAGIPYLLIKGAGLAYTHYRHSWLRDRCDTDILFPDQAAFERAWALLEAAGFSRQNTLSGEFVGLQHSCRRPLGPANQQVLDCHIKINDYLFFAEAFDFAELYEYSVAVSQLAASARTLGPVHALLVACIHRVATLPLGDADRMIWLYDMHLLARSLSKNQWVEFFSLARERELCGSCLNSLNAAQRLFPIDTPGQMMNELQDAAKKEPFKPGDDAKRWQYYFQVFRSVRGWRNKLRLLREHFLPSADYVMRKYQTSNRLILPFLYVHRVFAGLKRYF